MNLIAEQIYFKVEREVTSTEQKEIEHERILYLYSNKIVTHYREFLIEDVIELSHRQFGEKGLLYIHTSSGLFTYTVKTSTNAFIEAFHNHREKQG